MLAWVNLEVSSALANSVEDIDANIESALKRDYIPFLDLAGKKSGAVAVVGSGPSLKRNWQALRHFKGDIIACNAACKFLLEKGVVPQYMLCFDADPLTLEFFVPHPEITYLLGSRCVPQAFEILKDCKVVVWHVAGDTNVRELLEKHGKMEPMIIGGSAAVTRAMIVAISMGYKTVHLYGVDSSFDKGDTHIGKSTTEERRMAVKCGDREFITAPWMTVQLKDIKRLIPKFQKLGIEFIVHGDGLIPHVARLLGCKTDLENAVQKFIREWKWRLSIVWQEV